MKCQCTASISFLAAIAILVGSQRVVADERGRRTRFVRAGSNVFTNDDETSLVELKTEEPTATAVLNDTAFNNNVFMDDTAPDNFVVAVARDPSNMLTNQIIGGYQGWFAFPGDGAPVNRWRHWFRDPITNTSAPEAHQLTVDMYPTTDEYDPEDLHTSSNILLPDGSYFQVHVQG
jgi:hypothetical protein